VAVKIMSMKNSCDTIGNRTRDLFFVLLWCCATRRTVPGSIPDGVTGFFSDTFPSGRTMGLGPTQPLVKTSTRNIPGGKGGRCVRLTTSPPSCAECHEIQEPKPPGTLWATPGLLRGCCYRSVCTKLAQMLERTYCLCGRLMCTVTCVQCAS
jgi:hypothetical protein